MIARSPYASRDRALVGIGLTCAAAAMLQVLDFGYGRDQGIYATVAHTLRIGGVPYRDAWDFKPPGIYFIYALAEALGGPHDYAIRWLEVTGLLSLTGGFALLTRRFLGDAKPGLLGAAFAIVTYAQMEFWHTGQPENFGAVLIVWALVASTAALDMEAASPRRAQWLWLACGLCSGLATLLKPTIGIGGAASVAFALTRSRDLGWRHGFSRAWRIVLGPALVGTLVPLALCAWFFASKGAVHNLVQAVFVFAPRYTAIGWERRDVTSLVSLVLSNWLFNHSAINLIGLLLLTIPFPSGRLREGTVHVALVLVSLVLGVFVQARLFLYHFGSVLPLTALLAGWGFWRLWERMRERWSSVVVFAAFIATLSIWVSATPRLPDSFLARSLMRARAWLDPAERPQTREYLYSTDEYQAIDNRRATDWVRTHTDPTATILVYGFTPELYVTSDRVPASRYIYNVPQRTQWSGEEARTELMNDLARSNPQAIFVEHRDFVYGVTGLMVDSVFNMHEFVELRDFVASHYTRAGTFGRLDVYKRHD